MTAPKADRDRIFESWLGRLATIVKEVRDAYFHQALWTEVRDEMQSRHPTADATFLVSYSMVYIQAQSMLIRRLADLDDETHSLASLILAIQKNPDVMTRTRYADMSSKNAHADNGDSAREWNRSFAAPGDPERLDDRLLTDDLTSLTARTQIVTTWATKVIAHLDPQRPDSVPKYGEIREALSVMADITNRYERLLERAETAFEFISFAGDWKAMFRPSLFPLDNRAFDWPRPGGYT